MKNTVQIHSTLDIHDLPDLPCRHSLQIKKANKPTKAITKKFEKKNQTKLWRYRPSSPDKLPLPRAWPRPVGPDRGPPRPPDAAGGRPPLGAPGPPRPGPVPGPAPRPRPGPAAAPCPRPRPPCIRTVNVTHWPCCLYASRHAATSSLYCTTT